jgi:hypothetical protein
MFFSAMKNIFSKSHMYSEQTLHFLGESQGRLFILLTKQNQKIRK